MAFQDKVVLVTGASSGIGAAIALKFAGEGAKVAIVGRNTEKLSDVSRKCEELGNTPLVIVADITTEDNVRRAVEKTLDQFCKIDVLVNNAGIMQFTSILGDNAIQDFDTIMATNMRSVVCFTNIAGPHIVKTKGNIINISSIAALGIVVNEAFAYCASKAALDHFTRSVALELAPKGVRVNAINPGPVETDILMNSYGIDKETQETMFESAKTTTPLGRISTPEDIADLTLFLASDKAKSITGSSYVADNGALMYGTMKLE